MSTQAKTFFGALMDAADEDAVAFAHHGGEYPSFIDAVARIGRERSLFPSESDDMVELEDVYENGMAEKLSEMPFVVDWPSVDPIVRSVQRSREARKYRMASGRALRLAR